MATENKQQQALDPGRNWAAITGFVLALVGVPILDLVFSCLGLKAKLRGLAIAGLVLSIIALVWWTLLILFEVGVFGAAISGK